MTLTVSAGDRWVLPFGSARAEGCDVLIDDRIDGWAHTGLRVITLGTRQRTKLAAGEWELVVVPLSGGVRVHVRDTKGVDHHRELVGRPSVFAGATDVAYAPAGSTLTLSTGDQAARIAVCAGKVPLGEPAQDFAYVPVADVPVELRGAGSCSREVRNFGTPGVLEASRIIACEVLTPAGNWSSYPPHKHDADRPGQETQLEEIYYFEIQVEGAHSGRGGGTSSAPVGYQRVYGNDEHPIDVLAEVRSGDVVLVPYGWHGPAMAAPGYDLYYLNVMAGPGPERAWLICDDPDHSWVRESWTGQAIDPRLPFGGDGV